MRLMGLQAIYRAPRTSEPHPEHRVYPYLLNGLAIERANHVGCADITYIPVRRGFLYLVAILDWASRYVLSWRLSNTLDAGFCVEALKEARTRHGQPEIFNTDQGSPFTGFAFTGRLRAAGVQISMDGRCRCMGHIFIERLWRSLKYEAVWGHRKVCSRVERRRVAGRVRWLIRCFRSRAAVRFPWARFLPPLSEPGGPVSGTGLSSGIMRLAHGFPIATNGRVSRTVAPGPHPCVGRPVCRQTC